MDTPEELAAKIGRLEAASNALGNGLYEVAREVGALDEFMRVHSLVEAALDRAYAADARRARGRA